MKKVISLILCLCLLCSLTVPAFANEEAEKTEYDGYSVIVVRGIDFGGLTYADGTLALNVDVGAIIGGLFKSTFAMFLHFDTDKLIDGIFGIAEDILSPLAYDKDGNSVEEISMVQYTDSMANYPEVVADLADGGEPGIVKTAIEKYGAENTYFFTYDWRKTPAQVAAELNALVEKAKENSNKDKVNIIAASMGGMVTSAYMYYYGNDSINSAVFLSGAQNGTYVVGDCLNGRVHFDADVITSVAKSATNNNLFLSVLLDVFNAFGTLDFLANLLNGFVENNYDKANDAVLRDNFGTLCGIWALCPDEDFASGLETIFGGHEEEYAGLLAKLNETKNFVESTENILLKAHNDGVKLSFVSNYNTGLVPVYERANKNGDMVLESELTSNFATFANLGETLSDEYIAAADAVYISPDKIIDASTALFKDFTWFVKDAAHVAADYGTEYCDFAFWLVESEAQPTVTANEKYPQFMKADENLSLNKLTALEQEKIFNFGC